MGGREQKRKSGLPRPSYLGSLNGFQIKAEGLPWTHSRRGCFLGNLPAPTHHKGRQIQAAEPGSLPSKLSQGLCLHSQHKQTLAAPLGGPRGTIHLQGPPPEEAGRAQSEAAAHKAGMGWLQTTWPASSSGWVWRPDRPKSSRPQLHTGQSVQTNQRLLCARVNTSCLLPLCRPSDHGPVALCKVLAPRVPKPISPITSPPCSRARNNH